MQNYRFMPKFSNTNINAISFFREGKETIIKCKVEINNLLE
jgi:hypothetical protein